MNTMFYSLTGKHAKPLAASAGIRMVIGAVLIFLSGCASLTDMKQPVEEVKEVQQTKEPSVTHLQDGTEGFVIQEFSAMTDTMRDNFNQAVGLIQNGQYAQGADLLETIVEEKPDLTAPIINLAIVYRHLDKTEPAEAQLKKALELVPGHPVASNEYGLLCRREGRFSEARQLYESALELFPEYYPIHRNLGILCDIYLNDPVSALMHYEKYSQAKPQDQQIKKWIAEVRNRIGE